jgi:hypothetical protein
MHLAFVTQLDGGLNLQAHSSPKAVSNQFTMYVIGINTMMVIMMTTVTILMRRSLVGTI